MEKIGSVMTQKEYMELLNELRMLEMEEEITGENHSVRMNEIKELLEIDDEEDD